MERRRGPGGGAEPERALDLRGLGRRFGLRWVLRSVTLEVSPGEVVALMGRNGSGKTTLLRIVATALKPSSGTASVFGRDLVREADAVREQIGMLGHAPGLYEELTASENLEFAVRMWGLGVDGVAVSRALDWAGLGRNADDRVRGFSAGMRRRLALARLFLRRPRLLLLDEPYASFDAEGIDLLNGFVRELAEGGSAVLLATHDLGRAQAVIDRVVELRDGRLAAEDVAHGGTMTAGGSHGAVAEVRGG